MIGYSLDKSFQVFITPPGAKRNYCPAAWSRSKRLPNHPNDFGHRVYAQVIGYRFADRAAGLTEAKPRYQTDILELTPLKELRKDWNNSPSRCVRMRNK